MTNNVVRRSVLTASLIVLAAQGAANSRGQQLPDGGERYALLVGVRKYDPNELRDLPYSEADVTELAGVLKGAGYKPDNIVLMTQTVGAEDTRFLPLAGNIRKELTLLLQGLDEHDSILVALAGHGIQFRGEAESYFCPAATKLSDRATLIPLAELYKELERSKAGLKLLLVDACRNDPQSDNSRARAEVSLESVSRPQRVVPPGGVVAFFSCAEGQKAFEHSDLKHGVFFHFVIEAMKGSAIAPDEHELVLPDLEKYVKRNVRDFVRAKYGIIQTPELRGTTRGLVPLVALDRRRAGTPDVRPKPAVAEGEIITTRTAGIKLKLIPAGRLLMGSPDGEGDDDEHPQHEVRITRPFYLGLAEVTQGQYEALMGNNPSDFSASGEGKDSVVGQSTDGHPVERISWLDAVRLCNRLSGKEGLKPFYEIERDSARVLSWDGVGYRLPTEAEWEYACRAGAQTRFSFGGAEDGLGEYDWFDGNSSRVTHPVGQKRPNRLGLFDMHGNVMEWCNDSYSAGYYKESPAEDPRGPDPAGAAHRVCRGGGWSDFPARCRSAYRSRFEPSYRDYDLGFRVARGQSSR
jgi:formylglycine-generating enzyme required for sulfatase activity